MLSAADGADDGWRLSLVVPLFTSPAESGEAPLPAVAEWLASNIHDEQQPGGALGGCGKVRVCVCWWGGALIRVMSHVVRKRVIRVVETTKFA